MQFLIELGRLFQFGIILGTIVQKIFEEFLNDGKVEHLHNYVSCDWCCAYEMVDEKIVGLWNENSIQVYANKCELLTYEK